MEQESTITINTCISSSSRIKLPYFGINHLKIVKVTESINLGKILDYWYDYDNYYKEEGLYYLITIKDYNNNTVVPYCIVAKEIISFAQQEFGKPDQIIIKKIFSVKEKLNNILYDLSIEYDFNKVYFIEDITCTNIFKYDEEFKNKYFTDIVEYIVQNYDKINDDFLKKNIMAETLKYI